MYNKTNRDRSLDEAIDAFGPKYESNRTVRDVDKYKHSWIEPMIKSSMDEYSINDEGQEKIVKWKKKKMLIVKKEDRHSMDWGKNFIYEDGKLKWMEKHSLGNETRRVSLSGREKKTSPNKAIWCENKSIKWMDINFSINTNIITAIFQSAFWDFSRKQSM